MIIQKNRQNGGFLVGLVYEIKEKTTKEQNAQ